MLKVARKSQGLTQSALAALIGLSQSRVSHLTQCPRAERGVTLSLVRCARWVWS
ncbi:helix-turn-helix domain-containing protein [Halotalea alkalilenta]|uniref:helix-turn-helix domain-containing protein n=1 Tax=Halotalea alkalilenta TaxID=376489 RepID=UPI001CBFA7C2